MSRTRQSSFVKGFHLAERMFREGWTWDRVSLHAVFKAGDEGVGMLSAVEAMRGHVDAARRAAEQCGIAADDVDRLIRPWTAVSEIVATWLDRRTRAL